MAARTCRPGNHKASSATKWGRARRARRKGHTLQSDVGPGEYNSDQTQPAWVTRQGNGCLCSAREKEEVAPVGRGLNMKPNHVCTSISQSHWSATRVHAVCLFVMSSWFDQLSNPLRAICFACACGWLRSYSVRVEWILSSLRRPVVVYALRGGPSWFIPLIQPDMLGCRIPAAPPYAEKSLTLHFTMRIVHLE